MRPFTHGKLDFFFLLEEGQFLTHHFLGWFLRAYSKNRFFPLCVFILHIFFLATQLFLLECHCNGFTCNTIEQSFKSYREKKRYRFLLPAALLSYFHVVLLNHISESQPKNIYICLFLTKV